MPKRDIQLPTIIECWMRSPILPSLLGAAFVMFSVHSVGSGLGSVRVLVQLGIAVLLFGLFLISWISDTRRVLLAERLPSECYYCRHSRTGLSDSAKCPECGKEPPDQDRVAAKAARSRAFVDPLPAFENDVEFRRSARIGSAAVLVIGIVIALFDLLG